MSKKLIQKTKFKLFLQPFLCLFIACLMPYSAFANSLSESQLDYLDLNNDFYYNPVGFVSGSGCYSGNISIYGNTAAEKIWSGLTTFLTPEQAAGVMGNMAHESNYFNPVQHEISQKNKYWGTGFNILTDANHPYGIGLIQWSNGRRVNLFNYIQEKAPHLISYFMEPNTYSVGYTIRGTEFIEIAGESAFDQLVQIELEFLRNELETSYRGIFDQHTVAEASDYFLYHVEKPADPASSRQIRATDSQNYYDSLINTDLASSSSGSSTCMGLADGGATDDEAQAIMDEYHELQTAFQNCSKDNGDTWCSEYHIQATNCSGGSLSNCVAFSQYFINRYTTYANKEGGVGGLPNGVDVVNTLLSKSGFTDGGTEPRAYAIFSKPGPSAAGHTGVVLRVDIANNLVVVGEASCSAYDWTGVHTYTLDEMRSGTYTYAYTDDILLN